MRKNLGSPHRKNKNYSYDKYFNILSNHKGNYFKTTIELVTNLDGEVGVGLRQLITIMNPNNVYPDKNITNNPLTNLREWWRDKPRATKKRIRLGYHPIKSEHNNEKGNDVLDLMYLLKFSLLSLEELSLDLKDVTEYMEVEASRFLNKNKMSYEQVSSLILSSLRVFKSTEMDMDITTDDGLSKALREVRIKKFKDLGNNVPVKVEWMLYREIMGLVFANEVIALFIEMECAKPKTIIDEYTLTQLTYSSVENKVPIPKGWVEYILLIREVINFKERKIR